MKGGFIKFLRDTPQNVLCFKEKMLRLLSATITLLFGELTGISGSSDPSVTREQSVASSFHQSNLFNRPRKRNEGKPTCGCRGFLKTQLKKRN